VALVRTDWAGTESSLLLWLAAGTLCIAVAEETLCRGILVTALRGGVGEVGVWFWSSLLPAPAASDCRWPPGPFP
jgi:membrane protease YdiL (CAAX protease family)